MPKMNHPIDHHELLRYIGSIENDINNVLEQQSTASAYNHELSGGQFEKPQTSPKIDVDSNSDPDDIQLNLQILLQLDENIRSELSNLLADHQEASELTAESEFWQKNPPSEEYLGNLDKCDLSSDDSESKSQHRMDEDDKSCTEFYTFCDDVDTSSTYAINIATQTSPSVSSTNLSWESSSRSDVGSSDDLTSWRVDLVPGLTSALTSAKSNSVPILENFSPRRQVNGPSRSQSDRHLTELEAGEACKWLRATGFPQYAQMYDDMQFPIDISQVAQDHPFLEKDVLHSLFRRLQILNSCAHLHQHRIAHHTDESDDEVWALSDKWTYQSKVRRWSRTSSLDSRQNIESSKVEPFQGGRNTCGLQKSDELGKKNQLSKAANPIYGLCLDYTHLGSLKTLDSGHVFNLATPTHQTDHRKSRTTILDTCGQNGIQPFSHLRTFLCQKQTESDNHDRIIDDNYNDDCLSLESNLVPLNTLTSAQLQVLRKLALLNLTAYMEKFCPSHRTGWTLDITKLIRKIKAPVYKDKNVFGVPITITLQRSGQVLPRNIEEALRWLQLNATDQIGIFRKPGVKSRIQNLRNLVETASRVDYSDHQPYDVADMVKQYFRELPEVLLTNKLSETFILIFQYVPPALRRESILWAFLLLPDEHLEVLQVLLHFLLSVSQHSDVNQMNESNLAMCFEPSLFHHAQASRQNTSGSPHPKELAENRAGYECLLYMLKHYHALFKVPKEVLEQCKTSDLKEVKAKLLDDFSAVGFKSKGAGWREYLNDCQANLLRETREKHHGWISVSNQQRIEIAYKNVADGIPLRFWRVSAEIEAPPSEVLHRILRERHVWDPELYSSKIVAQLESCSEVFQFVRASVAPRPAEEYCVIRTWRTDLRRDSCSLVETSVEHPGAFPFPGAIRGLVLASRYLVEPCGSGRSRLVHFSRVDTMGRAPEWYQKHFGHLQAFFLANIQSSFSRHQRASGPESKV